MINKLICWLLGHKLWERYVSIDDNNKLNPELIRQGWYVTSRKYFSICPRCGAELLVKKKV